MEVAGKSRPLEGDLDGLRGGRHEGRRFLECLGFSVEGTNQWGSYWRAEERQVRCPVVVTRPQVRLAGADRMPGRGTHLGDLKHPIPAAIQARLKLSASPGVICL